MDFLAGIGCPFYSLKSILFSLLALQLGALQLIPPAALAQQSVLDYKYGFCNPATFSSNDSFAQNLNSVAISLTKNSSQFLYGLASSESGSQSNYVYGMYQCRGDISLSDCSDCVRNGFPTTSSLCGALARGVRVRHRGCYLRYEGYIFADGAGQDDNIDYEVQPTCTGSSNESFALYQKNLGTALENSATAAPKHALFGYNASSVGSLPRPTQPMYSPNPWATSTRRGALPASLRCPPTTAVHVTDPCLVRSRSSFLFTYNNSPPSNPTPSINSPTLGAPSQAPTILASPALPEKSKNHTPTIVGVVVGVCIILGIIAALALCFLKRRSKKAGNSGEFYKSQDFLEHMDEQMLTQHPRARRFSLKELQDATANFHPDNKLGEGGFGPVYQGRLTSGIEVAIKMLSTQSHQGKAEFLNEVNLITTIQHRNLIQLVGCCVEGSKPLLIYEYLPNRSLDLHLFGSYI